MDASRRRLLAVGAAAPLAGLARAEAPEGDPAILDKQPWQQFFGPGVDARPYGHPSKYEAGVVRRNVPWLTASSLSSVNFTPLHELEGIITPNGLCFERHHAGAPDVDPETFRLMVNGFVERPMVFTLAELRRFPRVNRIHFLECAANSGMEWRGAQLNGVQYTHGMVHCVQYTGVLLRHVLEEAGLGKKARWIMVEGGDAAGMNRSIPLDKALDDCLLAFAMNGEALRPEQGYPLRLVVPGWEGNLWIKWLRRIEVGDAPWQTREETSKYTDLLDDGKARQFSFAMDAKSVITSPSPQAPLLQRGRNVISGLAWSGRGRVARVDVSLDGGRNWRTARLDGPRLDKALTRFYLDIDWQGQGLLLQSRVIDETGYVQPTKEELRQVRGENSIYHNNGIQTWHVKADGVTENVEVS